MTRHSNLFSSSRECLRILLAAVVACAAVAAPCRAAIPEAEWPVNAMAFVDEKAGFAVGDGGLVLRTEDGGLSWRRMRSNTSVHLLAVATAGPRVAYAAGGMTVAPDGTSRGVLLRTVSQGQVWLTIGPSVSRYLGLSSRGKSVAAWCEPCPVAPGGLLLSRNEGESWTAIAGQSRWPIVALRWSSDTAGIALTADGRLWKWSPDGLKELPKQTPPGQVTAAHAIGSEYWVAALDDGRLALTRDAGRTWTNSVLATGGAAWGVRAMHFHSLTSGRFAAVGPLGIGYTPDAGSSWTKTGPSPAGPIRAVWFHDAWNGLAAGPFGTIYRTTDGGTSWTCVRGRPRRAGLIVAEPFGSVGDWPLVSMLSADRGHRTLLWWLTRPGANECLILRERRLRDAAWQLGGVEAMICGPLRSARRDGPTGFAAPRGMPHGPLAATDAGATAAMLRKTLAAWRPSVVLAPATTSNEPEEALIARAATEAVRGTKVKRWAADPENHTGTRLPGAESAFNVAVGPVTPSEEYAVYHGVRAQLAAQSARRWPAPVAESLGYRRIGATDRDPHPVALLKDIETDDRALMRTIPPTARVPLSQRLKWESEATRFHQLFKANLAERKFDRATGGAGKFERTQISMSLGRSCLLEIIETAAPEGDTASATRAAFDMLGAERWTILQRPLQIEPALWLLDTESSREWRLGLPDNGAATKSPTLTKARRVLARRNPGLFTQPDFALCDTPADRSTTDPAAGRRARLARAASLAHLCRDPLMPTLIRFEQWLLGKRKGDAPLPLVTLTLPDPGRHEVTLSRDLSLIVREIGGTIVFDVEKAKAESLWLTVDTDRDGRTFLAEPFIEDTPPESEKLATGMSPVWVRKPKLWRREIKADRLALGLRYKAIGGRPEQGTVWFVVVRRQTPGDARPSLDPSFNKLGCFALEFK
jgi:photosystem II stability/assembly factor-like uncharacterized protein/LmbE family N-acetylglucosaminyl deacetylase